MDERYSLILVTSIVIIANIIGAGMYIISISPPIAEYNTISMSFNLSLPQNLTRIQKFNFQINDTYGNSISTTCIVYYMPRTSASFGFILFLFTTNVTSSQSFYLKYGEENPFSISISDPKTPSGNGFFWGFIPSYPITKEGITQYPGYLTSRNFATGSNSNVLAKNITDIISGVHLPNDGDGYYQVHFKFTAHFQNGGHISSLTLSKQVTVKISTN